MPRSPLFMPSTHPSKLHPVPVPYSYLFPAVTFQLYKYAWFWGYLSAIAEMAIAATSCAILLKTASLIQGTRNMMVDPLRGCDKMATIGWAKGRLIATAAPGTVCQDSIRCEFQWVHLKLRSWQGWHIACQCIYKITGPGNTGHNVLCRGILPRPPLKGRAMSPRGVPYHTSKQNALMGMATVIFMTDLPRSILHRGVHFLRPKIVQQTGFWHMQFFCVHFFHIFSALLCTRTLPKTAVLGFHG